MPEPTTAANVPGMPPLKVMKTVSARTKYKCDQQAPISRRVYMRMISFIAIVKIRIF
jgi:hypothetical protein